MAERDAGRDESRDPLDEDAAWAELVAAYGEQPDPATGRWPATGDDTPAGAGKDAPEKETPGKAASGKDAPGKDVSGEDASSEPPAAREEPPGSFIVYAPGVGPRDWSTPEPPEDGADDADDEGHFIPPEPPPLPTGDVTARFAWIAVLGGPLLLLIMVLLQQQLTWWVTTVGVGGFLGGFATLVLRMKDSDDEDDDPGRGAVV
ncbi:hypothetical protein FGW37_08940 [Streptomyces rectiverticillatus]|uniref:hypothetical protein n=1 Tax=Streptomyces rectiverticillatus TaxID=173860 RepID=UPI0015C3A4C1|nr:hypothetical protein [Streptomyces rectiverticillatus]QLE71713.1 hypothetical protein FGW37_08940 [Streptomyces rectiverticillatus]